MNILEYPFIVIVICKTPVQVSTCQENTFVRHQCRCLLVRKTPDQLFSFNRRMCLLILGKDIALWKLKMENYGAAWIIFNFQFSIFNFKL